MERQTTHIQAKSHAVRVRAVITNAVNADLGGFASTVERTARILAALAKADLIIVPKPSGNAEAVQEAVRTGNWSAVSETDLMAWREAPIEGTAIVLDADGERAIREAAASPEADDPRIVGFSERPNPEVQPDDEPEAEKDNWGLSGQGANDLAHRYGCRVGISGKDDPSQPNTYYDDLRTYAVVTDRSTGRLVGLVECWDSEDGDPIVPRTWLETVLKAWRDKATPKRAA